MDIRKIIGFCVTGLFWSSTLFVLVPFCGVILLSVYDNFLTSSIAFTLDTTYLHWNTTFPAITVCEIYNGEKNWDISEKYFGLDRNHKIDDFISEITFFRGMCEACSFCENISCPTNFDQLFSRFRSNCVSLISNCSWVGKSFECCDEFRPVSTEYGICFAFNSAQSENSAGAAYLNNRETGPGQLTFSSHEDIQIHLHPPNDIPFLFSEGVVRETVLWGSNKEIFFDVMDIYNDPSIASYSPARRKCRFQKETYVSTNYRLYSFSTCMVECLQRLHLSVCKCHFLQQKDNSSFCNIEGLKCLTENYVYFNEMRKDCGCLSSCEEPEYNIVFSSPEESNQESEASKISIFMIDLPTQRYVRQVVKSSLDFTISVGGIAGLYFGASVLSIIEIFYLIMVGFRDFTARIKKIKRNFDNYRKIRSN